MKTVPLYRMPDGRICVLLGSQEMDAGEYWQKVEVVEYDMENKMITHLDREMVCMSDTDLPLKGIFPVALDKYPSRGY